MQRSRLATVTLSMVAAMVATLTLATPAQAAPSDHYVALGDSYSSGVGAGNYTAEGGSCNRSTGSYPALYAANVRPASYRSVACGGATTASVLSSQVAALSANTTLVSITVGGNDVGFASIMTTCVISGATRCVAAVQAAQDKARASLTTLLRNVYSEIRNRAPSARVVVLGYPVFYQLGTTCIGLSATSRAKINEGINLVNDLTRSAATAAGFTFADVRSQFVGHQLCSSGTKWLHALNIASIGTSYHPTAAGQSGGYYPVFRSAAG